MDHGKHLEKTILLSQLFLSKLCRLLMPLPFYFSLSHGSDFITTSPKKYTWSMINLPVKVLDFGMELWLNISKHVKHRRQILLLILDVLEITSQGECLEMRGFPLLSEFSVSLIYVLGHLFEKVS